MRLSDLRGEGPTGLSRLSPSLLLWGKGRLSGPCRLLALLEASAPSLLTGRDLLVFPGVPLSPCTGGGVCGVQEEEA